MAVGGRSREWCRESVVSRSDSVDRDRDAGWRRVLFGEELRRVVSWDSATTDPVREHVGVL